MIPLYQDPVFTFRFVEDRLIDRFHLGEVRAGKKVTVFRWQEDAPNRAGPELTRGMVDEGGWVTICPPLLVRKGGGFVVAVQPD